MRCLAALLALLAAPALAAPVADNPGARLTLAAETARPVPGKALTLAITFQHKPGWHSYWKNPGDAGIETRAAWSLPAGATATPLAYPTPGTLIVGGLMNHVYEKDATLLAEIAIPASAAGAFPVKVKLDYLICTDEICVPEAATLDLPLSIGDGAPDAAQAARFAAARAALPRPLAEPATYRVEAGRFILAVPVAAGQAVTAAHFFPLGEGVADFAAPQSVSRSGDTLRLETGAAGAPSGPVAGVLRLDGGGGAPLGLALTARPGPVPAPGSPLAADAPGNPLTGFASALLFAIAGGILLNVMPCVFPILSLKALSLAKAGGDAPAARRDALAYAAGSILVCLALGGVLLALRAAGEAAGWAFQLQDPRVVVVLLLLVTAIALNLAGLFEITLSPGASLAANPGGGFMTGALAAFVATPCTGPFMAGALGAALVLPPAQGLAIFGGLGFGLALPFLAIGFIPALRRRLPRPGAWMVRFRQLMSIPMFLTALALAWVLGRQAGVPGMTAGLAAVLALGLALWWFGRQQAGARPAWLPLAAGLATVLAAIVLVPTTTPATAAPSASLAAAPFSEPALASLRAARTPAFVYFTADWCVTCKVNERTALADAAVGAAFTKAGVKTLVGDWTNGDAAIGKFIAGHGRAGVPLYLFYHADGRIEELPQLLTASRLIALTT